MNRKNQTYNDQQKAKARPRAMKAIKMHAAGMTWREIGASLGITAQRAHKLASAHQD